MGWIIGIQLLVSLLSGALISLLNAEEISGANTLAQRQADPPFDSDSELIDFQILLEQVDAVSLQVDLVWALGRHCYLITTEEARYLFDARTGLALVVSEQEALYIAERSYVGEADVLQVEYQTAAEANIQWSSGALWRVVYQDSLNTNVYVSAETAQVVAHINDTWRLFDFLLMLHFMDYGRDGGFNNPQIVIFAFGALWLVIAGGVLVFDSLRCGGYRLSIYKDSLERGRIEQVLFAGDRERRIQMTTHSSLYEQLLEHGIALPSDCGGVGDCGLCRIQYLETTPAVSEREAEHLSEQELAVGIRLACRQRPMREAAVRIDESIVLSNARVSNIET